MGALHRAVQHIHDFRAKHGGRNPKQLTVSWRERYRLMTEMRNLGHAAKPVHWRKENKYDQFLARGVYAARKFPQVYVMGVLVQVG